MPVIVLVHKGAGSVNAPVPHLRCHTAQGSRPSSPLSVHCHAEHQARIFGNSGVTRCAVNRVLTTSMHS